MPCSKKDAAAHYRRLSTLPYYSQQSDESLTYMVEALARAAKDADHAAVTVDYLLANRMLPQNAQDIQDAATAAYKRPVTAQACGIISTRHRLRDGSPSRCVGGWVRHTVWRELRGMVTEEGTPMVQAYDFVGRCSCQPGGTVRL